jgi:hypothetical protein
MRTGEAKKYLYSRTIHRGKMERTKRMRRVSMVDTRRDVVNSS